MHRASVRFAPRRRVGCDNEIKHSAAGQAPLAVSQIARGFFAENAAGAIPEEQAARKSRTRLFALMQLLTCRSIRSCTDLASQWALEQRVGQGTGFDPESLLSPCRRRLQ